MINKLKNKLKDKKIVIVGFGKEGISTYNFIRRYFSEQPITIMDDDKELLNKNVFLKTDDNVSVVLYIDYSCLNDYDLIIKSAGVSFKNINIDEYRDKISSQMELVLECYRDNIIGVTGTKGKSTTTSLIFKVFNDQGKYVKIVGNIGIPIFDEIDDITENTVYVIEMSALQLEFVDTSPHIGIILNLFEEHLDFFANKESYFLAKMNMFKFMNSSDYGLYTSDSKILDDYINKNNYDCNLIDIKKDMVIKDECVYIGDKKVYNINDKRNLLGKHNLIDIEFVLYLSELSNLDLDKTVISINEFKPLEHRLELVGTYDDVTYYNDAIATIPSATINAIETLENVNTLIFGGMDRGINYDELISYLRESNIKNLVCMPTTGYKIGKYLEDTDKNIYYIEMLRDAVRLAKEITEKGTICLMSPAASSYEYFKNFEDKGSRFKEYVRSEI